MTGEDAGTASDVADATEFGIEEEFVLLDPETLRPAPVGPEVLARLRAAGFETATSEFLASQIEFASPILHDGEGATAELVRFRREAAGIARELGVVAASTGTPFDSEDDPEVFPEDRYARVHADIGAMIADHQVCGLHVHLGIAARADRVRVLNGLRPWIPMLTALAANAPFHRGVDSGFASWRTIVLRRWTTNGVPAPFADEADYDRRLAELVGVGVTRDRALIAWMLRLSHHLPTVELRFADAQLDAADSVAIALLCRALVRGILQGADVSSESGATSESSPPFSGELIDAALWAAAHDGHEASVPDPVRGTLVPVRDAVASALASAPDDVRERVADLLARGSGAERQRAALAGGGRAALRALFE